MVLSLGIALYMETHCENVSVVTVAEEGWGHFWLLVLVQIDILWSVRPSHTVKDLSTLNITMPLMRDTALGRKGQPPCGPLLLLLPPLASQPPASPPLSVSC